MALKPDRDVHVWDISKFYPDDTRTFVNSRASRGGIVVATGSAVPSGAAMDQSVSQAWYAPSASGRQPLGMMMNDVVDYDLTRQSLNPNKSEVQVGDKITIMQKGWAVTNMVNLTGGPAIAVGGTAYVIGSGNIGSRAPSETNRYPTVGKFLSRLDEDGYAKVYIDL